MMITLVKTQKCWEGKSSEARAKEMHSIVLWSLQRLRQFLWERTEGWGDVIVDICPELCLSTAPKGGGGYRKKEVLQHLTLSHLWKNTTDWALKVFQYLPITALATIKADTAEIFSPAVHICSFLIFFCIVLISFVCLGLFFLQNQQLSNPITRAKLGTSVLMFQEVTLWWYSYTPASFSAIRKNRARSCSHRTSKNSYFFTYSSAWSILPVTNAVIAQLYASGRKWSKVTQLTYI